MNDGKIKDVDTNDLDADCPSGGTSCTISSFISEDLGNTATYTNAYFTANQKSVKGYVKAKDAAGQATYSAFIIYLTRKLFILNLNNIYSL